MDNVVAFLRDKSGASATEYVGILAIVGGSVLTASTAFGVSIAAALGMAGDVLKALTLS